jgi:hypothetical protein
MNYEQFHRLVSASQRPVILLEGTRALPEHDCATLTELGRALAEKYPHARFRTGNAEGADEAFAEGVKAVDPSRLEYILPYARHRKEKVDASSYQLSLAEVPHAAETRAVYHTAQASPEYATMIEKRHLVPLLRAKSRYILRDTVKVIGAAEASLAAATAGIFYINAAELAKGGTGHTMRVCRNHAVPVVTQAEWMTWPVVPPRRTKARGSAAATARELAP